MNGVDRLVVGFDRVLKVLLGPAPARRDSPAAAVPEAELSGAERRHAQALMRVNHTGEVCAQALYQGQSLSAREPARRALLLEAAAEEMDHLAWTEARIRELGGRTSLLNPFWYAGSLALGALAGLAGDRWSMGFLAETERQVEQHLSGHLERLPASDQRSRRVLEQMRADEVRHAQSAFAHGAAELPRPARDGMRLASKVMTTSAYWL
jgi:ubiquinone biosynthesis monooxygenase Coq7